MEETALIMSDAVVDSALVIASLMVEVVAADKNIPILLSYQLSTQRAKADIILFIKPAERPMKSPKAKPDIIISVLSTMDIPQDSNTD